eukprot:2416938-Rhodomonas_salina.2
MRSLRGGSGPSMNRMLLDDPMLFRAVLGASVAAGVFADAGGTRRRGVDGMLCWSASERASPSFPSPAVERPAILRSSSFSLRRFSFCRIKSAVFNRSGARSSLLDCK